MELSRDEINTLSEKIAEKMRKMGIEVIDSSIYSRNSTGNKLLYISIIVGYIPEKAAVFIAKIEAEGHLKFVIENETREEFESEIFSKAGGFFLKLKRNALGAEWSTSINTYIRASISESDRIEAGINFFKNFLATYGNMLKVKFTKRVTLHVIPFNSDVFEKAKTLLDQEKISLFYKDRMIALLPAGFFPEKNKSAQEE